MADDALAPHSIARFDVSPLDIGTDKQLLFDDFLTTRKQGFTTEVGTPLGQSTARNRRISRISPRPSACWNPPSRTRRRASSTRNLLAYHSAWLYRVE